MISGTVSEDGVPLILLQVADKEWQAIVDTGFNGDLELPAELISLVPHEYLGRAFSMLAGGGQIEEDCYAVDLWFDKQLVRAEVTFVPGHQILLGTRLLRYHHLEIDFPARSVSLQRC